MTNLLRIIQHMKPVASESEKIEEKDKKSSNPLASKFPGLAIPNDKPPVFSSDEDSEDEKKNKRVTSKEIFNNESKVKESSNKDAVQEAMAALEALAPSNSHDTKEDTKRNVMKRDHSRDCKDSHVKKDSSRERKRRRSRSREKRSRSRERRSRSRERRSRSRDRRSRSKGRRSRSRDRDRRRRSRSKQRHRSRSRDRHRRSRSRNRRSKSRSQSRGRDNRSRYRESEYNRKPKKSPEVAMSDDPEPGKVIYTIFITFCIKLALQNLFIFF